MLRAPNFANNTVKRSMFPAKFRRRTSLLLSGFTLLVAAVSLATFGMSDSVVGQQQSQQQNQTFPQSGQTKPPIVSGSPNQNRPIGQPTSQQEYSQQAGSQQIAKQPPAQTKNGVARRPNGSQESQFDQDAAFEHLKAICKIGPRVSASVGMRKQQRYIDQHFKKLDGKVYSQLFKVRSPYTGKPVQLSNIIVQFHPERKKRLLICCHHDTRPFPDKDLQNPRGQFIGANDGASGVGLLCELGRHMQSLDGGFGVDLVFFDGEEFVIDRRRDQMFLGSTHFANEYAAGKLKFAKGAPAVKYEYGLLVDMIGDKDLQIYFEGNSLGYADGLTRSIWTVANEMGVKEFIPQQRHQIRDDHLPLNSIAGIRTVDIIDFDYPNPTAGNQYWHTQKDVVENCSAESLGKVGKVVLEWLRRIQELNKPEK